MDVFRLRSAKKLTKTQVRFAACARRWATRRGVGQGPIVRRSWLCGFVVLAASFVLSGCAGYKLGPTNGMVAGAQSIQVNPFQNNTLEPRLIESVTSSLRKQLQQDGTYTLNTSGDGDVIVTGVITAFERSGLSYQPNDVLTVRDYELSMRAIVTARERGSGKVLLEREVAGRTSLRVGKDLASAERQAIPMLADDLARRTTSLLVDGAW